MIHTSLTFKPTRCSPTRRRQHSGSSLHSGRTQVISCINSEVCPGFDLPLEK